MFRKKLIYSNIIMALGLISHDALSRGTIYNETLGDDVEVIATADTHPTFVGHAFGVYIKQDEHTVVGNNLKITVSGQAGDGLRSNPSGTTNWQQAKGSITIGDGLQITTSGVSADGINANGSTQIKVGNNAIIKAEYDGDLRYTNGNVADGAHAVRANFHANIEIGDDLTASTKGKSSYAIYSAQGTGLPGATEGAKIYIGDRATATTIGTSSHAAYVASKKGVVDLGKNATLTTEGDTAHAAYVTGANGIFNAGSDAILSAVGDKSHAIYTTGTDSVITLGDKADLSTGGSASHGLYLKGKNSVATLGNESTISTLGDGSHGLFTDGYRNNAGTSNYYSFITATLGNDSSIKTAGNGSHGVYMYGHESEFTLNDGTTVETTGDGSHALYGHGSQATPTSSVYGENGKISVKDGAVVKTSGTESHAAFVDWATSSIDFYGGATISATGTDSYAVYAKEGAISGLSPSLYTITGNMKAEEGGSINFAMTDGSTFIGNTTVVDGNGTLDLDIDGANSIWKMDTDSDLTSLNLTNNANVYLSHHTSAVNDTDGNITLTIGNLSGNGTFYLRSDISGTDCSTGSYGDLIRVTGTSSGQHKVFVNDNHNGSATVDGTERLKVVETADGGAEFELSNVNGYVDLGAYKYELVRGDNLRTVHENWWLQARPADPVDPTPPTPPAPPPEKNNTADRSGNILNINYLMSYVENQTLLQRMGEIRRDRHTEGDVWVRAYTGKLSSFADSSFKGFDMNYDGIQIGADKYIAKDFYIGMMMGSSKGKVDYEIGDGQTKSYHLGLYGTYKSENGWYVDTIAKVNRIKNNFDTQTGGGYAVNGYGNANGLSLGVEAGKRFYKEDTLSGLYIEPQLQYTYSHQSSSKVKATNGLVTDLHSFDSHIGRASVILGYTALKGDTPVDVYLKTGYVREFDGKTGVTFNGKNYEEYKFNGNWWDNGIGASVQVKQHHNFYLEADYSKGNKFDKKQVNVGYRYAF